MPGGYLHVPIAIALEWYIPPGLREPAIPRAPMEEFRRCCCGNTSESTVEK